MAMLGNPPLGMSHPNNAQVRQGVDVVIDDP